MNSSLIWYAVLVVVVAAFVFVFFNYVKVKKLEEGTDEMVEMAGIIRSGAGTFLKAEFKVIAIIGIIIALVFSLFVEATSGTLHTNDADKTAHQTTHKKSNTTCCFYK